MSAPNQVKQGENYTFSISSALTSSSYLMEVKQYPDDDASISRAVTPVDGEVELTSAETESLAVGLWFISVKETSSSDEVHHQERVEIKKAWL